MIPPARTELRQHSEDLINLGKNLHKLNGVGRAFTKAGVVAVALVAVLAFLPTMFA